MPNVNYSWRTAPLTSKVAFYICIQQTQVSNILNMVYILSVFSSSKCSLFHNSNVFGSCIIHILYIYSTNIGTEYFKHGMYICSFFFSSKCSLFHNSKVFGSCIIYILYTGCAKIKKIIPRQKVKYVFRNYTVTIPLCNQATRSSLFQAIIGAFLSKNCQ